MSAADPFGTANTHTFTPTTTITFCRSANGRRANRVHILIESLGDSAQAGPSYLAKISCAVHLEFPYSFEIYSEIFCRRQILW